MRNSLTTAEYLKPNPTVTRYTTSGNTPSNNTLSLATVNSRGKGSVVERREQPSNSQITHSPKRVGSLSPILPAHLSHDGHPFNSSSAIPMYRSYPELSKLERELLTERGDKDTERDRDLDNSTHSNLSNASTATPLALDLYASAANLADPTYTYSSRGKGMAVTATSEDLLGHVVNEDDDDDNNTKNHENKNKKGNTGGSSSSSSSSGDTLHTCKSNSNTIDIGKRRPHSAASSFGEWSKEDANRRMYGRLPTNESKVDRTEKNGDADNNNGKGKGKSRSRRKGVVNRVDDRWSDRNNNGNDVDNDDELDCELAEDELSDSSDDEEENDGEQRRRSIDYEENGDSGDGDNDSEGNSDIFRVTSASAGTGTAIGMDKFASTSASCLTAMCCVPPSALPLMHMHPNKEDKNLATTRTRAVVRQLKDLLAEFRLQAQGQAQVCQQGSEEGHADTKEK